MDPPTRLGCGGKACDPGPRLGRPSRFAYVVSLADQPAVASAARRLQRDLRGRFLIPIPDHALHVTVLGLDYMGSLSPTRQETLIVQGGQALREIPPFTLQIANATATFAAVGWEVHDGGAIRAIRARLWQALPWLLDERPDPYLRDGRDIYRPHVSVGYFAMEAETRLVIPALQRYRPYPVAELSVDAIDLVRAPLLSFDRTRLATSSLRSPTVPAQRSLGALHYRLP